MWLDGRIFIKRKQGNTVLFFLTYSICFNTYRSDSRMLLTSGWPDWGDSRWSGCGDSRWPDWGDGRWSGWGDSRWHDRGDSRWSGSGVWGRPVPYITFPQKSGNNDAAFTKKRITRKNNNIPFGNKSENTISWNIWKGPSLSGATVISKQRKWIFPYEIQFQFQQDLLHDVGSVSKKMSLLNFMTSVFIWYRLIPWSYVWSVLGFHSTSHSRIIHSLNWK